MSEIILKQLENSDGRLAWRCLCGGLITIKYVFNPHDETCDALVQCCLCKEIRVVEFMNRNYPSLKDFKIAAPINTTIFIEGGN